MKFARTLRMDSSDTKVYDSAAEPGEWAVTGTFAFVVAGDPETWSSKQQLAFKGGWLGTESFGWSTFVQVAVIPEEQYEATVRRLAAHIFETYGAPDMLMAAEAARAECADMASLCDHPAGTILAIERDLDQGGEGIGERVRVIPAEGDGHHARIWAVEDEG